MKRRTVLAGACAGLGAAAVIAGPLSAATAESAPRSLRLYNVHTGEAFADAYHNGEGYLARARDALDWFLRDHHVDAAIRMDPAVLDLLWRLQERYRRVHRRAVTINIHSAYRTRETNERLIPEGAARNSYHLRGQAVDISVQGLGIHFLNGRVREIGAGGVGVYRRGRFAHIDTGPRRSWYRRR